MPAKPEPGCIADKTEGENTDQETVTKLDETNSQVLSWERDNGML